MLAILLLTATNFPAQAHLLKVFATIEDGSIVGYAFFVGGGRPDKAQLIVQDRSGKELYRGNTNENGDFNWRPQKPQTLTIIVNAGDGHMARSTLDAARFDPNTSGAIAFPIRRPEEEKAKSTAYGDAACTFPAGIEILIDRSVDRAVSRQVRPLLEAFAEADSRIRLNDIVGGIGMIFGLAGIGMWMSSRRPTDIKKLTEDNKTKTEVRA
jgi:nickel transport protein